MITSIRKIVVFPVLLFYFIVVHHVGWAKPKLPKSKKDTISIEDLRRYKKVIDSLKNLKDSIGVKYKSAITNQAAMQSASRFKEIKETNSDSIKLKAIGCTTEEREAFQKIIHIHRDLAAEFKREYTQLITDSLGIAVYNKITKAVKNDSITRKWYNELSPNK